MGRSVLDIRDWVRAGIRLMRADPTRYMKILGAVEKIVDVHEDPMSVSLAEAADLDDDEDEKDERPRVVLQILQ